MFISLVLYDKLFTNANRVKRGFLDDPWCKLCEDGLEDLDHLLRKCPHAKVIWQPLGSAGVGNLSLEREVNDWIAPNWPTKFTWTCWYIWKWKNTVCSRQLEDISHDNDQFLRGSFNETIGR